MGGFLSQKKTLQGERWDVARQMLQTVSGDPTLARQVNGYTIVRLLGQTSLTQIYKAFPVASLDEERAVAVKVLRPEFEDDPKHHRALLDEAMALRRLAHPNLVRLYDIGDLANVPYFMVELLEGDRHLGAALERGRLKLTGIEAILNSLAAVLVHLHEGGVVHGNLRPHKVALTSRGLRLTDLGIACLGAPSAYRAPDYGTRNPSIDQYSLGVIGKQMLADRHVAPVVAAVLERMAAPTAPERFASMQEAATALFEAFPRG